ncbi:unnamed protein product [Strongylus vulgaris]|uniref:Tyrosinase copper-binding domain-containing protein n=1 Tax=Strongylus vulgaris TaxID=40348 RepID=A0A3P7I0R4_STRVU|nr:unnamed protein product [Strongylus vulgaris]
MSIFFQNGEYDKLSTIHKESVVHGGAHSGPAFLPWHRELTKRFEFALRQIDPNLYLPYWDSTMDGALARPQDSVIFSAELEGTTDARGFINSGPYLNFRTLEVRNYIIFMRVKCFIENLSSGKSPSEKSSSCARTNDEG